MFIKTKEKTNVSANVMDNDNITLFLAKEKHYIIFLSYLALAYFEVIVKRIVQ